MFHPVASEQITANELPKMDFVNVLPLEVSLKIFSYLNGEELANCFRVNKVWKVLASDDALWNALPLPKIAFGKKEWNTYLGDIGKAPTLPREIHKILKNPCPFWPEKTVEKTHMLVLIPKTVNGKPLTLFSLHTFVKQPKEGYDTKYRFVNSMIEEHAHQASSQSHWVLMTKNIVPKSRDKEYPNQQALIAQIAEQTGMNYEVPSILEATICILTHYIRSGERLFDKNRDLWTYTRCQEHVQSDKQIIIGNFDQKGVLISCFDQQSPFFGVAASCQFS